MERMSEIWNKEDDQKKRYVKELVKLKSNYELRLSFIADSFISHWLEFIHQSSKLYTSNKGI